MTFKRLRIVFEGNFKYNIMVKGSKGIINVGQYFSSLISCNAKTIYKTVMFSTNSEYP